MLRSLYESSRKTALWLASSLCERTVSLPGGGSSLDREWRFGLYRALSSSDVSNSTIKCNFSHLFMPNTGRVYSSAEKNSMSNSIIVAGVLSPPEQFALDAKYVEAWRKNKCDVIAKLSFPKLDGKPEMPGQVLPLDAEIELYKFMTKLVESNVTPNLVLGLADYRCTVQNLRNTENPTLSHDLSKSLNAIYLAQRIVPGPNDPVRVLLLERGRGCDLQSCLIGNRVNENQFMSLLFQTLYTLHALAQRGVRHGDLHAGNVFVDVLGDKETKVAYFINSDTYYEIPTYGVLAKLYDWDWGGIYATKQSNQIQQQRKKRKQMADENTVWPTYNSTLLNSTACTDESRREVATCNASARLDAFTLLTYLFHETSAGRMPAYRQFLANAVDDDLLEKSATLSDYGGFEYRYCGGITQSTCEANQIRGNRATVVQGSRCNGFEEPKDCEVLPVLQMLNLHPFLQYKHSLSKRYPQTKYIFGNWQTEQQHDDLFRILQL